ncbi:hypothetical protein AVEN_215520-1 [Araneus ventricosus]|uniref:Tc1-like transposase DDE domain-containing protein n=1 Tax=Araneus ventricosus TaxID=182803 RepID=A0A4Y2BGT8_ARAVE|nr:hypothetical protein AVEN_215520-1 [Araneus ventricosus]
MWQREESNCFDASEDLATALKEESSSALGTCSARELVPADVQGSVNTQNCRIWARENPFQIQPLTIHSQKVTKWCGFTAAFIVDPFFFEEIGPSCPVTCTVNGTHHESLLRNQLIPALQQRGCVYSTIFVQDDAPSHIATSVKQLLNLQF